jgi:hypothetical protein
LYFLTFASSASHFFIHSIPSTTSSCILIRIHCILYFVLRWLFPFCFRKFRKVCSIEFQFDFRGVRCSSCFILVWSFPKGRRLLSEWDCFWVFRQRVVKKVQQSFLCKRQ